MAPGKERGDSREAGLRVRCPGSGQKVLFYRYSRPQAEFNGLDAVERRRRSAVGAISNKVRSVGIMSNMPAELLLDERHVLSETAFAELVVWRVPVPVRGSAHEFRYRLALVVDGKCVLRYDNEAGKGDHRHAGGAQRPYRFKSAEQLLADFWTDVDGVLR